MPTPLLLFLIHRNTPTSLAGSGKYVVILRLPAQWLWISLRLPVRMLAILLRRIVRPELRDSL